MKNKANITIEASNGIVTFTIKFALLNNPKDVDLVMNQLTGEMARLEKRPHNILASELFKNRQVVKEADSITWIVRYQHTNPDFPTEMLKFLMPHTTTDSQTMN